MTDIEAFESAYGLVPRSHHELVDLPINFRWEVTRRHPYYSIFWRQAARYRRAELKTDRDARIDGYCAMRLLELIGVTGEPQDPSLSFSKLGELSPIFGSGTIQPMTIRNLVRYLVRELPANELSVIATILNLAADGEYAVSDDADHCLQKRKALLHLEQIASDTLDSYSSFPPYHININASQRRIVEDVELLVRNLKKAHSIPERRLRIPEFDKYLEVWDAREGWKNGAYHPNSEQTFKQLALNLGVPKSTIKSRYRAAFQLIVGTTFTTNSWLLVVGQIKLPLSGEISKKLVSRYRRLMADTRPKPAPESRLSREPPERGNLGVVERNSAIAGTEKDVDLLLDLQDLIDRGYSDEVIATKLELPTEFDLGDWRHRLSEITELE